MCEISKHMIIGIYPNFKIRKLVIYNISVNSSNPPAPPKKIKIKKLVPPVPSTLFWCHRLKLRL